MQSFFQQFLQSFFALIFIFIYIIAVVLVFHLENPFRAKKRSFIAHFSVLSLVFSYVMYLGVFLAIFYMLCFNDEFFNKELSEIQYFVIFASFVIANIVMAFRRSLRHSIRKRYFFLNYIYALFNLAMVVYLLQILIYQ